MWKKGLKPNIKAVTNVREFKHKSLIAKRNRRGNSRRLPHMESQRRTDLQIEK